MSRTLKPKLIGFTDHIDRFAFSDNGKLFACSYKNQLAIARISSIEQFFDPYFQVESLLNETVVTFHNFREIEEIFLTREKEDVLLLAG